MPPDIELRRFAGLFTDTADIEGEMDRLIRAENVMFDQDGVVQARHGFHLFSNAENAETALVFLGKSEIFFQRILASLNFYYLWEGGKTSPSLNKILVTVTSGSRTTNVVTLNVTPSSHGIVIGDQITVNVADATYNGLFTVTGVGAGTVQYSQVLANDAASGAGTFALKPKGVFGGNTGVEYNTKVYFPEGRYWDGGGIRDTPQIPDPGQQGYMAVHAERLWLLKSSSQSRLYFSNPGAPEVWPAANFIDIDGGAGSLPAGLMSYQGRLYIFKREDIFVLDTPGLPSTWILRRFARIGCQPESIKEYNGTVYWVAGDGAYRFDGTTIEKLSDAIDDVFKSREPFAAGFGTAESALFRDQWVIRFFIDDLTARNFCFNVKTEQWSEWVFPWETDNVFPVNIWSEPRGVIAADEHIESGIYMTTANLVAGTEGLLLGTEIRTNDYWRDETGTHIAPPTTTEHTFNVSLQTKFSEFGDPTLYKRVHWWMFEWEGQNVLVEQVQSDRGRVTRAAPGAELHGAEKVFSRTLPGNINHPDRSPGDVFTDSIKGLGMTRKMSLRITALDIRDVGFKLYRIAGKVVPRGTVRRGSDQVT